MNLFLAKSANALEPDRSSTTLAPQIQGRNNKVNRISNAEESIKAFAKIREDNDDLVSEEDSESFDFPHMPVSSIGPRESVRDSTHQKSRLSSATPITPTSPESNIVISPDKPKSSSRRKYSISKSTAEMFSKSISAFSSISPAISPEKLSPALRISSIPENSPVKSKTDDIYNGILSTTIDNELRDVFVRIDETAMIVSNCGQTETFLELDLKKAIATPKRTSSDFEFDFISPRLRQAFLAPTYLKMIEWMAVINSAASTLAIEPTGNMYSGINS
jgi:hypothetical protein